jgi:hypothetical protein
MTRTKILRNVAAVAACLAAAVILASCEKIPSDEEDEEVKVDDPTKQETGAFTKRAFKIDTDYQEMYDMLPVGIYYPDPNLINTPVAKGADSSIVIGDNAWQILDGKNYYDLFQKSAWYVDRMQYPQTDNDAKPYSMNFLDDGWSNIEYSKFTLVSDVGAIGFAFISSDDCEKTPQKVANEKLFGFDVKRYTYVNDGNTLTMEYWVLPSGFCLKRRMYLDYSAFGQATVENVIGFSDIDSDAPDCNTILAKLKAPFLPLENVLINEHTRWAQSWFHDLYPADYDNHYSMVVVPYPKKIAFITAAYDHSEKWLTPGKVCKLTIQCDGANETDMEAYIADVKAKVPHLTLVSNNTYNDGSFNAVYSNECHVSNWNCPPDLNTPTYGITYKFIGNKNLKERYQYSVIIEMIKIIPV